ncbi:AsmA family protein [Actibacterium sp.]|uniref:AsmA family protein n=1 Tax=Actibacterium sp. TaxID=1872125 RepID=UPI0035666A60
MRWLIRVIIALLVLVALLFGGLFLLPADKVAALASEQIRKSTGRELSLSGRLKPSIWPQIGMATGPVTLSNADWASDTPMLAAEGLEIGLDIGALLGGDIVIRKITVTAPEILLERAKDGRVNWDIGSGAADSASGDDGTGTAGSVTLDVAQISNGAVTFIDHAAGTTQKITDLDATLKLPDLAGAADVAMTALVNGQQVKATARIDKVASALEGRIVPLELALDVGKTAIGFEGRAGLAPLSAEGALKADLADLPALFTALGQAAPDLPSKLAQGLAVFGQVTYAADGALHLRDGDIRFGPNALKGAADVILGGARPHLTGQFTTGALDLTGLSGGGSGGGVGAGWSTAPIDVSALGALDADVALAADSIALDSARLGATQVLATLADRRLSLKLQRLAAYQGQVTGSVVVNGRGGLSVAGDLSIAGVAMKQALTDLAGYSRLSATADMKLKFLGSGASMAAIMSSLSGDGSFTLGPGELSGVDMNAVLRRRAEGASDQARTIFNSVTGTFIIAGGVLTNDDMVMQSDRMTVNGNGKFDLGAQTMGYHIVPEAFYGEDGAKVLKIPLRISGPWSKPKFMLDVNAVIEERRDEKADELKQKAAEKLGVETQTDETLEDAAKRKLKEEAARGLRNLLKKE